MYVQYGLNKNKIKTISGCIMHVSFIHSIEALNVKRMTFSTALDFGVTITTKIAKQCVQCVCVYITVDNFTEWLF